MTSCATTTPMCTISHPMRLCSWRCSFFFYEGYGGILPHWGLFCHCFEVFLQLDTKVTSNLWNKVANQSPFFYVELPSNVVNWAKTWFCVYDCGAPSLSHKFPSPLSVKEKKDMDKLKLHQANQLVDDLWEYHRLVGLTGRSYLVAFF